MTNDWITIFTTDRLYQAEFIKETLEINKIEAVILNQKDSSYHFGSITVKVKEADQEKATEIINSANCE